MEIEQRINTNIEWIRIVAVVLITFTHTRHNFESGIYFFLFEQIAPIGTALLSIISGYLYATYSYKKQNLLASKVKSLIIPYLLANLFVLTLVLVAYYGLGVNFLNRFNINSSLFFDGLLSLNSPPINPPTYFIRDIFVIFSLLSIVQNRNYYVFLYLIPLIYFGKLFLSWDVVLMFALGGLIGVFRDVFFVKRYIFSTILIVFAIALKYYEILSFNHLKFFIAPCLFLITSSLSMKQINVGAYSYLTHLYHSPIIVCTYPIIAYLGLDERISVVTQVLTALMVSLMLFVITRKVKPLRILCGFK